MFSYIFIFDMIEYQHVTYSKYKRVIYALPDIWLAVKNYANIPSR